MEYKLANLSTPPSKSTQGRFLPTWEVIMQQNNSHKDSHLQINILDWEKNSFEKLQRFYWNSGTFQHAC